MKQKFRSTSFFLFVNSICLTFASPISSTVCGLWDSVAKASVTNDSISVMSDWTERRRLPSRASNSRWMWSSMTVLIGIVLTRIQSTLISLKHIWTILILRTLTKYRFGIPAFFSNSLLLVEHLQYFQRQQRINRRWCRLWYIHMDRESFFGTQTSSPSMEVKKLSEKNTKMRLYTSIVIPSAIYASENWKTTDKTNRMLKVFKSVQQKMSAWHNGSVVKDHMTNKELLLSAGVRDLQDTVTTRRRRFIRHVLHLPTSRLASLVIDWTPEEGSRRWGRPKRHGEIYL